MKHSLHLSFLPLATVALQATAAVVDYVSGAPISSSGYYQYHTKWVTTTCYETITKSKDCSYDGGDFVGDYETVSPQVHPGPDYNDYNTVYETVYETAYPYPYPYETAQPYPHEPVCYPETVYSTVYPESSDNMYHTFTASGMDETIAGSPVYHTMDSTIFETVIATPSGDSGSECSNGPWIVNPDFEGTWPGAWFPSEFTSIYVTDRFDGRDTWAVHFTPGLDTGGTEALLEQAIIIPNGTYLVRMWLRSMGNRDTPYHVVISLGSYASAELSFTETIWGRFVWHYESFTGPSGCVPVVFSIKVTYDGVDNGTNGFDMDEIELVRTGD